MKSLTMGTGKDPGMFKIGNNLERTCVPTYQYSFHSNMFYNTNTSTGFKSIEESFSQVYKFLNPLLVWYTSEVKIGSNL